ncbi:CAAX amino terminal protease self- immunity [bacterium BMS3Abin06]|nr:CAAX amino terminal protease self- immunity [bacterium BMS3Abin06]
MEGAALLLALLLARYFNINLLPLTDSPLQDILTGTAAAVPPFILFLFTLSEKAENIPIFSSLKKTIMTDLRTIFANAGLFDLVLISLLAGFAEEILFRGVLQAKFGIVAASVVFGLIHCVSPAYVVVTTIMGFYIGALYYASESLLVPVQMHFIYDLAVLIYIRYFLSEKE